MRVARIRAVLAVSATTALLTFSASGLAVASAVPAGGAGAASAPSEDPPPLIPPLFDPPPTPTSPEVPEPEGEAAAEPEPLPEPEFAPEPVVVAPEPGDGPALLASGSRGRKVQELQVRLQRVAAYDAPVTGKFGKKTVAAVRTFQKSMRFVRSGKVDKATHEALVARAGKIRKGDIAAGENNPYGSRPAASCLTGSVVCVDKTARTVRWIVDGQIELILDARFGGSSTPTREGVFTIQTKSKDHVSKLYGSAMPFAMFFSGGQAVHYSADFASRGYYGASHGCVNTRQFKRMAKLFKLASVGDRLVVYHSRKVKG